jgi:hypothetical protein
VANFQQGPVARTEKLAVVAAAISQARCRARRSEPLIDEGLRLIKAFHRIAGPAVRRRLVEQAEDLGRVINGKS